MFLSCPQETFEFNKPKNRLAVHNVIIKAKAMFAVTPFSLSQTFWRNGTRRSAFQRNLIIYPRTRGACCMPFPMPSFTATSACSVAPLILQRSWCLCSQPERHRDGRRRPSEPLLGVAYSEITVKSSKSLFSIFSRAKHVGKAFSQSCCLLIRYVCKRLVWPIWLGLS